MTEIPRRHLSRDPGFVPQDIAEIRVRVDQTSLAGSAYAPPAFDVLPQDSGLNPQENRELSNQTTPSREAGMGAAAYHSAAAMHPVDGGSMRAGALPRWI